MINFFVYGNPKALKRHRMTKTGHVYDPSEMDKKDFLAKSLQYKPKEPWRCPIEMVIQARFPRPKSHYGTGKNENILKETAPDWYKSRPDADNLIKFVCDALNGVFYKDDSQIARITCDKFYGESGHLFIVLKELEA